MQCEKFDVKKCILCGFGNSHIGMAMRWGGVEGWGIRPRLAWFCLVLSHPRPVLHDGECFLTPSPPLRAPRSPAPPCKTLLFVNFPYN